MECVFSAWRPGIGDPHPMGWVTVGVYLLAGLAAAVVAWRGAFPPGSRGRERVFWTLAALLLLFLAVNKQLDLQSFMTAAGRCMAQAQGWYENRRLVQLAFILGLAGTGVLVLLGLRRLLRGTLARTGLALLGLVLVTVFVLIRAAGFHHMDLLIGTRIAGMRLNWLLELPGPLLVLAAALRARLTPAPGCKE